MQIISNKTASIKNMIGNALRTAKEDGLLAAFGGMLAGTVGIGATMAMLEHLPMRISNNPVIEGAAIGGQMLLATGSVILTTMAAIKIGSTVADQISKGVDFLKEKAEPLVRPLTDGFGMLADTWNEGTRGIDVANIALANRENMTREEKALDSLSYELGFFDSEQYLAVNTFRSRIAHTAHKAQNDRYYNKEVSAMLDNLDELRKNAKEDKEAGKEYQGKIAGGRDQLIKAIIREEFDLDAHPENEKAAQEFENSIKGSLLEVKRVDITPTILKKLEEHRQILDNAISFIEATATDGSQAKMVEALTDFSKSLDEKASKEFMQAALNKLQDQFEQKMPTRTTEVGLER